MKELFRVTLKDIASSAGVSAATVSLALRNHPRIPAGRRGAIQEIARRMGYRPDAMASALVHKRVRCAARPVSAALAWINHWDDPRQLRGYREFDLYWQGASRAAEKKGFRLEEFAVGGALSFRRLDQILESRNIQGVLVPPHGRQAGRSPGKTSLDWDRYAVVKFGYSIPGLPAHIVAGNHVQGVTCAFSRMRERGYRRVGYLCHDQSSIRGRAGFLMHQLELPPEERLPILEVPHEPADILRRLETWLQKNSPDAIFTEVAGLPALLEKIGIRVPGDLALAATSVLDGNVDAGLYQNSEEIGRIAAETVIDLIFNHQTGFPGSRCEILVEGGWRDGTMLPDRRRLNDEPAALSTGTR